MSNINTNNMSTNNDIIDALWVMGGARVLKDNFKNVVGYTCYCDKCKIKSASGNGGISFSTADELLEHRNMKAFKCPSGCGFHVCEERSSIIRHINEFHQEIMNKFEEQGFDPKKSWIIPDYGNHTYTLNKPTTTIKKPIPDFDNKSPIDNAAAILDFSAKNNSGVLKMQLPKRVVASPSPNASPTPYNIANAKSWANPIKITAVPLSDVFTQQTTSQSVQIVSNTKQSGWHNVVQTHFTPLNSIMVEQFNEEDEANITASDDDDEYVIPIHYAQEDMRKEKQCSFGAECSKKDRPFACALNHDGLGDIINVGTILSEDILCPYERPGFKRCLNGHCTKIHLEGRVEFIETKKKAYFENKQKSDNSSDLDDSSVYVDEDGIEYKCSKKDAIAIQTAMQEFGNTTFHSYDGDWCYPKTSKHKSANKLDVALNTQNIVAQLS